MAELDFKLRLEVALLVGRGRQVGLHARLHHPLEGRQESGELVQGGGCSHLRHSVDCFHFQADI